MTVAGIIYVATYLLAMWLFFVVKDKHEKSAVCIFVSLVVSVPIFITLKEIGAIN